MCAKFNLPCSESEAAFNTNATVIYFLVIHIEIIYYEFWYNLKVFKFLACTHKLGLLKGLTAL